jgi:hypothetical protein
VAGSNGTRSDTFFMASKQIVDCGPGPDIWYTFRIAGPPLIVYLDTFGSNFDTSISLRNAGVGGGCTGAGQITCQNDACTGAQDRVFAQLGPGTYFVAVTQRSMVVLPPTAQVSLRWQTLAAGSSGNTFVIGNGTYGGTLGGPSFSAAMCFAGPSGPEWLYYYMLCPTVTRTVSASTCGLTPIDTVLNSRRGVGGPDISCANDMGCSMPVRQEVMAGGAVTGPGLFGVYVDSVGAVMGAPFSVALNGL